MNIASLLAAAAARVPDRAVWIHGERDSSYRHTTMRVARLAAALQARGMRPGDRVVLVLPNGPALLELLWATFWAGLVAVPVNRHLHAREVAYVVDHCTASAIVVGTATEGALAELGELPVTVLRADDTHALDELCDNVAPVDLATCRPDDPAWLFYTSGTTGRPKGATLSHRGLLAMTLHYYADVDPVTDDAVFLHAAPLTHGSGLYLLPAVGHGATNVIATGSQFDPADYLTLAEQHGVTHFAFLAPTMLNRVVDTARARALPQHLRSVVVGGAPLHERDLRRAVDVLGPVITQMYGQGESPMTITVMPPRDLPSYGEDDPRWRSCGRAFTGLEVAVVDADGSPTAPGETGEIRVRGDVVMSGYWGDPDATALALSEGWLCTGDVGHLDQQGFLYLTDRSKDVIITGGSNVYPREVEEALLTHPEVSAAAVIGVPDLEWGESVHAFVVLLPDSTIRGDDLVAHTRTMLASFKKPQGVTVVKNLPTSPNGKVLKRALRKEL